MISGRIAYLIVAGACLACASEHHGTITSGGLPIAGATVSVTQGEGKFVTTTDEHGEYSFPDLADGTWTIGIEMFGFGPVTKNVFVGRGAPSLHWELKLLPLALLEQQRLVEASANEMRPREAIQRGGMSADLASGPNLVSGFQPLGIDATARPDAHNGRASVAGAEAVALPGDLNANALAALTVIGSLSSGLDEQQRDDSFSSIGAFVPGGLAVAAAPGTLLLTGPGGPVFGPGLGAYGASGTAPSLGGGGFEVPRGSAGGNSDIRGRNPNAFGNGRRNPRSQYNGDVALILDNSALDAKPFSLTGQNTPKAAYQKFSATGTFGGPLKIPHLISGQKTFFSINYQLTHSKTGSVATGLVPTEAERAGIFAGVLNPLTGLPVILSSPHNVIPQSMISSQAEALLNLFSLPNFSGGNEYNYQIPITPITNQSNVNSRLTETINSKNQWAANFGYQSINAKNPNLFDFLDTFSMTGYNTGVQWTYHFTSRLISNLRYQFSRSASQMVPYFANMTNFSAQAGIAGNEQTPQFWGPPTLSFSSGFASLSDGNYSLNHNTTNAVGENILWVRNKHTLMFGGDFRRLGVNQFSQQNPRGSFLFNGSFTGFDMADFLLGYPATSSIAYGNADKYLRAIWIDTFVTDDWRINSRLSLNIGVRWDFQGPFTELQNRLVNLAVGPNFTSITPVCATEVSGCTLASQLGYPNALVRPDYHEIQPRIGIAWRPFKKNSTVVRAGYGIYYNTSVYQPLALQMSQQSPLSYSVTQPNSLANPYTLATAFLTPAVNATPQTFALDPNFQIGYLHYWQISLQQNLSSSLVATLTYNGDLGLHQVQRFLPDSEAPGAPKSPYPSGYIYEASNGTASYNGLSAQLQRRLRAGASFNAGYTFSKALDDSQALGGRGTASTALAQNWLDLGAEKSLSSFNRTHVLNFTAQYSPGQGLGGGALLKGWEGTLVNNWTFMPAFQIGSGLPLTPIVTSLIAIGTGISSTVRADVTGAAIYAAPPGLYLNPAAFVAPPAGEWGNAGRNIITGPMVFSLNSSLGRVFRLPGERCSLDLRFDATNVLNRVTFTSWNTKVGSSLFGLPTAASPQRAIQATLRFRF